MTISRLACAIFYTLALGTLAGLLIFLPSTVYYAPTSYTETFSINRSTWDCNTDDPWVFCGKPEWHATDMPPWCRAETQDECFQDIPGTPSHFYMYHPYNHWIQLELNTSLPLPPPTFTSVQFNNPNLTWYPWNCTECQNFKVIVIGLDEPIDMCAGAIAIPETHEFWVNFTLADHNGGNTVRIMFDNITLSGKTFYDPCIACIMLVWVGLWGTLCAIFFYKNQHPEELRFSKAVLGTCTVYQTVNVAVEEVILEPLSSSDEAWLSKN